jgi:hypothetical protein
MIIFCGFEKAILWKSRSRDINENQLLIKNYRDSKDLNQMKYR